MDSKAFWKKSNRGQLVKSPIELIAGTHRLLKLPPVDSKSLIRAGRSMQQDIYEPPNVRGWIGGTQWINSQTLLARRRFINSMLRDDPFDPMQLQANLSDSQLGSSILAVVPSHIASTQKHPLFELLRSAEYQIC